MIPEWFWFLVAMESGVLVVAIVITLGSLSKYIDAKRREVYKND